MEVLITLGSHLSSLGGRRSRFVTPHLADFLLWRCAWLGLFLSSCSADLWVCRGRVPQTRADWNPGHIRGGILRLHCEFLTFFSFFFFFFIFSFFIFIFSFFSFLFFSFFFLFFFLLRKIFFLFCCPDWHWSGILWQPVPQLSPCSGCVSYCVFLSGVHRGP